MLSDADRKKAADILITAEKERKQAVQLTKTFPDIAFEDAYAISTGVANRKIAGGAKLAAIDYTLPTPSAQIKSAVLLAGLGAEGETIALVGELLIRETLIGDGCVVSFTC